MEDSDKWASQIINELFEDKKFDVTQNDVVIKDCIDVSVNKETEISILPTHLDISRREQIELSNAEDFSTELPIKSEENQLFTSHGEILQPLNCLGGVSVALSDETSFTENDVSDSYLNCSDYSCNFMEFRCAISKSIADQTDIEENSEEQIYIKEHAVEEHMKSTGISVISQIKPEKETDTIYSAVSNSSYLQNDFNEISLNKTTESLCDEDSSKKGNKSHLSRSLSFISKSDSSLNALKLIDKKMKLLGLDGITKKDVSEHRNKELSVHRFNMYKNIFSENYSRENIPFISEQDDETLEKSQVEDILAVGYNIYDHHQGFDTSQYNTEIDFKNLENDSNTENSRENINSKTSYPNTTRNDMDINEYKAKTEENLVKNFDESIKDIKSSLLVLRSDTLNSAKENTESKVIKSFKFKAEKIAPSEIPYIYFEELYRRPSFNNDDGVITQRCIKIVETYRKACTTFEVLCVRPFAFFLAETIDFFMFVLFVLVYLIYVFYEQINRLIVRKCLRSIKSHYDSLKREGQKVLLHFSSSNYVLFKQTGITLDKESLTKSFQNKVIDKAKRASDVCATEFNVNRIARGLDGICETGEKYLISLCKEQHSANLQICEDALVDIIQSINYVDKMHDSDEIDFDMEVIASSNVAKELKENNDCKYSILGESKANVESAIPGSEVNILHSTRLDQLDSVAVAKHGFQSSQLEHNWQYLKSDLNIPCAISENSAHHIHLSESSIENSLNSTSMAVNVSKCSTQSDKIISLNLPSLTIDSKNDVSEYICRNLKGKHDFYKKVNDSEKVSENFCSSIDPSHCKLNKKNNVKKKLRFPASKRPVIGDNSCSEPLENKSETQQKVTDQFFLTRLPLLDENLEHSILTTSSSNEFKNGTRDSLSVEMDLYSNESKDKNKGKIRRRMSTIFTNWRSINMMPRMKAVSKNKQCRNSSDSVKV